MEIVLALTAVLAAAAAGGVIVYDRRKTKKTLRSIDAMIEGAMRGDFSEKSWDESLLSAVEAKLARYLASSEVSSRDLREQKAAIETLIADISHQTKTPIANILLYAQLLEEQDLPEEARPLVTSLTNQSEKLKDLIGALVKASRLESGVLRFSPKRTAVQPMLAEAVSLYTPKAAAKQIELTLTPTSAEAVFDPKWTLEAIANLIDNAVKYTPAGGHVEISVTEYESFCRISVRDSGPGIAEDEQAKVFARFWRSPSFADEEGVGIGLYLAREIVTGQSGYIKLESKKGEGATFSVFLPRSIPSSG